MEDRDSLERERERDGYASLKDVAQRAGVSFQTVSKIEAMTLGDRVAVMRGGVLQQVGSPRELYEQPDNLFVAGFMGSPSINLVRAQIAGGTLRSSLGEIAMDDRLRDAVQRADGDGTVVLGLRPEHFVDAAVTEPHGESPVWITRDVGVLEAMGAEYYAYFDLPDEPGLSQLTDATPGAGDGDPIGRGGSQLIARLPIDSHVREGEPITLWYEPRRLQVFDPASGRRVSEDAAVPA